MTIENKKASTTIILVDNSPIDNFVNEKIITRYQFADNVKIFAKSSNALKYLLKLNNISADVNEMPFMLFLYLDMPEIDGFDFLNAFSLLSDKIRKNIKIVILTNSYDPIDIEKCKKHDSVVALFHKPLIRSNIVAIKLLLSDNLRHFHSFV